MMDGATILVVFISLLVVAVFAGIGIGLVIGLVLWGRDEGTASPLPELSVAQPAAYAPALVAQGGDVATPAAAVALGSFESAPEPGGAAVDDSLASATLPGAATRMDEVAVAPVPLVVEPVRPGRRPQSWSVALAIVIIVICCVCTFLLAALTAVTR